MDRNIHEGRILIGLIAMSMMLIAGLAILYVWWLPFVMAGAYAVAYVLGTVIMKVFDL